MRQNGQPQLILIATGSEVGLALSAKEQLEKQGYATRVVSAPCLELFDQQDHAYRENVLPSQIRNRLAIEAGATCGWWKYTGLDGDVIGLDHYGASAPAEILFEKFGFTIENILAHAKAMMERNTTATEKRK